MLIFIVILVICLSTVSSNIMIDKRRMEENAREKEQLRQIIINIMTNAVKYTAKGHVLLTVFGQKTGTDKVTLYVSVKDTGIGIKDEDNYNVSASADGKQASGKGVYDRILVIDDGAMNLKKIYLRLVKTFLL